MRSLLVLGGARSGKSRYAEQRVGAVPGTLAYLATAQALDDEMAARIARHRADRGERWHTLEAPINLPEAIGQAAAHHNAILVDCLTLWLTNIILTDQDIDDASRLLEAAIAACPIPIALVANEVGLGIVPDNALSRRFRDEAGRLNQKVAQSVEEVVMVAAGLPLHLKKPG